MMTHKALAAGVVLGAALLSGCSGDQERASRTSPGSPAGAAPAGGPPGRAARRIPVAVAPVMVRELTYTIAATGSLQGSEVVRVPARVAGVVQDVSFQEGSRAPHGKVLARIDPERYRLAAARAEATWKEAEARVREAEAALEKRRRLHEKDAGWVSAEELSNFSAQLEQTRAATAGARAAFELASKDLRDSAVVSPVAGIIDAKLVGTGQYVTSGTPIATMVDTRRLKLVFKVAESESVRLSGNPRVTFKVSSISGREFSARLYHIGQSADATTRMVECFAWVEDPGGGLRPGFFADVTIAVEDRKGAIVVPQTAVLPTEQGFVAYVMKGEDEVEQRKLQLGLYTPDGGVEVIEGLTKGEKLVVRGASALSGGSKVEVEKGGRS